MRARECVAGTTTRRCRPRVIHNREKEKMKTLWWLGGLGLGAGLMYLLDAEKGAGRRDLVRGYVADSGRQAGALLDDTRRTLGRQAQAVSPRAAGHSDVSRGSGNGC